MPRVSRLLERRGGRVLVELDGEPWRTLPQEVVVRSGLLVGTALDRERARMVRAELRRAEALRVAVSSLRTRERSSRELAERLERAGVAPPSASEALATLEQTGLVDDTRFARSRAEALAARGYGDAAIRYDLGRRGLEASVVGAAIAELEPEAERAAALVEARGRGAATAAYLARRGFGEDVVEQAFGAEGDQR